MSETTPVITPEVPPTYSPTVVASYNVSFLSSSEARFSAVERAQELISRFAPDIDSIAVRGTSGAMIGAWLASHLNCHLTLVRKSDGHHADESVSGLINPRKYVIVDDCMDSGATIKAIKEHIKFVSPESRCVGVYLYGVPSYSFTPGDGPGDAHYLTRFLDI